MKEIEDWKHITHCRHEDIVSEKKKFIAGFQVLLDRHKTYPPLTEFFLDYMKNNDFTEPMEPLILNPRYTVVLHEAFTSQSRLGWDNFSKGLISEHWKRVQYRHLLKNENKDIHAVDKWARMIIRQMLEFYRSLWKKRCDVVAAEKEQTYVGRQRRDIWELCQYIKKNNESLPEDKRHLLEKPESYFFSSLFDNVLMWKNKVISSIDNNSIEARQTSQQTQNNTQDLRRFCKRVRPKQARKRGRQEKDAKKKKPTSKKSTNNKLLER